MKKHQTRERKRKGKCFETSSRDLNLLFLKDNPKHKGTKVKELNEIWERFTDIIREELMEGNVVKLPYKLGDLQIAKRKSGKSGIDWNATKSLWERDKEAKEERRKVNFNNLHTDGYVGIVVWSGYGSGVKNQELWKFNTNRAFRRQVISKQIQENPEIINKFVLYTNIKMMRDEIYQHQKS